MRGQRVFSIVVATLELVLWGQVWGAGIVVPFGLVALIPLACIWFPETLSDRAGIAQWRRNVPFVDRTPVAGFQFLGWSVLLGSALMLALLYLGRAR